MDTDTMSAGSKLWFGSSAEADEVVEADFVDAMFAMTAEIMITLVSWLESLGFWLFSPIFG